MVFQSRYFSARINSRRSSTNLRETRNLIQVVKHITCILYTYCIKFWVTLQEKYACMIDGLYKFFWFENISLSKDVKIVGDLLASAQLLRSLRNIYRSLPATTRGHSFYCLIRRAILFSLNEDDRNNFITHLRVGKRKNNSPLFTDCWNVYLSFYNTFWI